VLKKSAARERNREHNGIQGSPERNRSAAETSFFNTLIERQPAHENIGGACIHSPTHGADIGKQIGVTEHDAFRVSGAAGGVLDESDGIGIRHRREIGGGVCSSQIRHALDGAQLIQLGAQQPCEPLPLWHNDEKAGARVAQDADLAAQVILELRKPHRGIDRHRNRTGVEDAEERNKEVNAGREH
jgi:hypothetical protein